jgi:DNA-binding PadR family transcriptional regulator
MSTLSDLQKKLQQESEGIMFPFRTATVSTTQPVLDTATDGIMSITGQKYIGPDSVIQYSPEGQRQLKEIEKGMLPQFDQTQFPDIGKGKVEDRGGAAPLPVDTTPLPQPEAPMIDPCPPGFKYDPVKKVCVPIEQPKSDRDEPFVDTRTNNQKGRDSLKNFGIKLTGGEDSIFADPEKTKALFGSKIADRVIKGEDSEIIIERLKGLEGVEQGVLGKDVTGTKIIPGLATTQQVSTGERFGELPTFTVEDFETGIPNLGPISILANFLGKTFIAPSTIRQLEKNGFIVKTGNKKNDKDEYTLSENGIRSIVQSEVDDDKPRMERSLRQQGFTQKQIDSGQALAEMRKDEGADVDKRVKEYQERESKKYTDKQKNDFMTKVNKNRFKDIGGLKQIKSDKFTGEGFTRGR